VKTVPIIAVALWLGAMAFFAFCVAPAAFGTLGRATAGQFVGAIFPRYYLAGTALGVLALAGCAGRSMRGGWRRGEWLPLGLVLLMLAANVYGWLGVLPAAHAAREAMHQAGTAGADGSPEAMRFAWLHGLASLLNGAAMLTGVVFLVVEGVRRR
jgi:hypothetical protein